VTLPDGLVADIQIEPFGSKLLRVAGGSNTVTGVLRFGAGLQGSRAMCTCELAKETQAPLLTRNKAIVIVAAVAAAATAAGIAVFGGDEELPPRSPAAP